MAHISAINSYKNRWQCSGCQQTWNSQPCNSCRTCREEAPKKPGSLWGPDKQLYVDQRPRCEGCGHRFQPKTFNSFGLCGRCATVYDFMARTGPCSNGNLVKSCTNLKWFRERQDKVSQEVCRDFYVADRDFSNSSFSRGYYKDDFVVSDSEDD